MMRLGLLWGCSTGLLSVGLAVAATGLGAGRSVHEVTAPFLIALFLAHSVLFGLLSGALGTVVNDWSLPWQEASSTPGLTEAATGLYSRDYMTGQLRHSLSRVARTGETVSILILETEERGDDVTLRLLADAAQHLIRECDILGRIGQGRLLLLMDGELPCALCLIQRLAEAFHQRTHLTLRAGVARWPEDGRLPADLLSAADLVLKASWKAGHASACAANRASVSPIPQASV